MNGDVICVDSSFSADKLEFWKEHGVVHPEKDKIYSIRSYTRHITGNEGITLEQIVNPPIPVKTTLGLVVNIEPTWALRRFRTLSGDKIKKEVETLEEV